jgi:hypothetical protein
MESTIMLRTVSRQTLLLALFVVAAIAVSSHPALAQGASRFTWDGKKFGFKGTDTSGNVFNVSFSGNPGDFLRQNPDGTYSIHAE